MIRNLSIFVLWLLSFFISFSFSDDFSKLLVKKWRFVDMQSPALNRLKVDTERNLISLDDSIRNSESDTLKIIDFNNQKQILESNKGTLDAMMTKMQIEGWIEFKNKNKFNQNMSGTEYGGTYNFDAKSNILITTDIYSNSDTIVIKELTSTSLIMYTPKDSTVIIFSAEVKVKK